MKRYGKITDVAESEEVPQKQIQREQSKIEKQMVLFNEDGHSYNRETIPVCAIVDSFEFFTNEHLEIIQDLTSNRKTKCILVNIRTNYNLTQEDVQMRMLDNIEREYRTLIENVINVRSSDISEILSVVLYKGYEPTQIIIQNSYKTFFDKMIESSDLHGVEFELKTLNKDPDYEKLYKYVMQNSWADFRKHVPSPVLNYFEAFKSK